MKVLYISHFLEPTGWGQVSRDYILAMDSVGIEVVPRAIQFNPEPAEIPERITELAQKDSYNCDFCIQHVLPHFLEYDGRFKKNIALFELETNNINLTSWPGKINLMDEAWVPCLDMINHRWDNGINIITRLVPHACDINKYLIPYESLADIPTEGDFIFYFIGELSVRKNIVQLIRAFHTEFSNNEPVSLLLKVNKPGISDGQLAEDINNLSGKIKENLKMYMDVTEYKREIIVTNYLSEKNMMRLHNTCDCFVNASHGEAWSIPAFDAMAFGKYPICSKTGGMQDFIKDNMSGLLVDGKQESVLNMTDGYIQEFGSARETWFNIDFMKLRQAMRFAFNSKDNKEQWKKHGIDQAKKYSYASVGKIIKGMLNG